LQFCVDVWSLLHQKVGGSGTVDLRLLWENWDEEQRESYLKGLMATVLRIFD